MLPIHLSQMARARFSLSNLLTALSASPARRLGVAAVALGLMLAIYGLTAASDDLAGAPLVLLPVPLAVASIAFGVRGGIAASVLSSILATLWWVQEGQPAGIAWLVFSLATYIGLGAVLGWFVDQRHALEREMTQHAELSLDLMATASFDGYFLRVNPAFERTLGYRAAELVARPFLDFVHPDDRAATLAAVASQTEAGRQVLNFQNRYRAKDGSYRWLEWTSRPDKRAKHLIAGARDVTDRHELEERDRNHQQLLERAVWERTEELRQRTADLEEAWHETLRRLAFVAEHRDNESRAHTERVGHTAALIAAELGLGPRDAAMIGEAALLHDVGKVGVSDTVLFKAGALDADEVQQMREHARVGAAILSGSNSEVLKTAEEIAEAHHEWWDGNGYPAALAGNEIPLTARIVAVADVFDALTHERPYKLAWHFEDAVAEIHRLSGSQFDPQVVEAFDRLDHFDPAGAQPPSRTRAIHVDSAA